MKAAACQRWRDGRASYRPADETINWLEHGIAARAAAASASKLSPADQVLLAFGDHKKRLAELQDVARGDLLDLLVEKVAQAAEDRAEVEVAVGRSAPTRKAIPLHAPAGTREADRRAYERRLRQLEATRALTTNTQNTTKGNRPW